MTGERKYYQDLQVLDVNQHGVQFYLKAGAKNMQNILLIYLSVLHVKYPSLPDCNQNRHMSIYFSSPTLNLPAVLELRVDNERTDVDMEKFTGAVLQHVVMKVTKRWNM